MNQNINLNILLGYDGGFVFYETVADSDGFDSRLIFGGNIDEATAYLNARMKRMQETKPAQAEMLKIEAPVKIRVRRPKPAADALDVLEQLEEVAE